LAELLAVLFVHDRGSHAAFYGCCCQPLQSEAYDGQRSKRNRYSQTVRHAGSEAARLEESGQHWPRSGMVHAMSNGELALQGRPGGRSTLQDGSLVLPMPRATYRRGSARHSSPTRATSCFQSTQQQAQLRQTPVPQPSYCCHQLLFVTSSCRMNHFRQMIS